MFIDYAEVGLRGGGQFCQQARAYLGRGAHHNLIIHLVFLVYIPLYSWLTHYIWSGAGDAGYARVCVPGGGQLRAPLPQHGPLEHRRHHVHHVRFKPS